MSSRRYKCEISPLSSSSSLDVVTSLQGVTYRFLSESSPSSRHVGFIAEEVDLIVPNLVHKDSEGRPDSISYTEVIPYLVESIKALHGEIRALQKIVYDLHSSH